MFLGISLYTEKFVKSLILEFIHPNGILSRIKKIIKYTSSKDTFYLNLYFQKYIPCLTLKNQMKKDRKNPVAQSRGSPPSQTNQRARADWMM